MAIRDYEDNPQSAKKKAADIIVHSLHVTGYWDDNRNNGFGSDTMTSKEKAEVQRQIDKFLDRIYRLLKV